MYFLISPLWWSLVIAIALIFGRRLASPMRWFLMGVGVVLVILMSPFGANALVGVIESQVPRTASCEAEPETILLLAGGFAHEPANTDDYSALTISSLRRLFSAVALLRQHSNARLVIAGGGPYAISESQVMARLAEQFGVPVQMLSMETDSQTTWQNAAGLRAMQPSLQRICLVSSAVHLPRAKIAFEAFGFEPCLYASDRAYIRGSGLGYFLPQSSSLIKAEMAIHEMLGSVVYRWRARSLNSDVRSKVE